jgi:hypothetical protein
VAEDKISISAASETTVVVTDELSLKAAIDSLAQTGGGTVLLDGKSGPYSLDLRDTGSPDAMVHLAPLDPDIPPVIEALDLNGVSGLSVSGMLFRSAAPDGTHDIRIVKSSTIELRDNVMRGHADGYLIEGGTAQVGDSLMFVRFSSGITFSGNTVSHYFSGIGALDSSGLRIEGNSFSHLQGDGIQGGGLTDTVISGNVMSDFFGSTQTINHSDMIQLWGSYTSTPNRNVTISDNVLIAGGQAATQGIFIRNEDFASDRPAQGFFEDITITGNLVHNATRNGISVSDVRGLEVSHNTVLWDEGASTQGSPTAAPSSSPPWILVRNIEQLTMAGNIAENYSMVDLPPEAMDLLGDNVRVSYSSKSDAMFSDRLFVDLSSADVDNLDGLMLRPDAPLAPQYGANDLIAGLSNGSPRAVIMGSMDPRGAFRVDLEAGLITAGGVIEYPVDAVARWHFDDGTVLEGARVTHQFASSGPKNVRLEIIDPVVGTIAAQRLLEVEDPVLLHLDFDGGPQDLSTFASSIAIRDPDAAAMTDGLSGDGFALTGLSSLTVSNAAVQLYDLDRFAIDLAINPTTLDAQGELFSQHSIMKAFVTAAGGVGFQLVTDTGSFALQSDAGVLSTGVWQTLGIDYSAADASLSLSVDGTIVAQTEAHGVTAAPTPWGLVVGRGWNPSADAVLDDLIIMKHRPPEAEQAAAPAPAPTTEALVDFHFDNDLVDASRFATSAAARRPLDEVFTTRDGRTGLDLQSGNQVDISRLAKQLSELDSFDLKLDFARTEGGESGGLINLHTVFDLDLLRDDSLRFKLNTDEGSFSVVTAPGAISEAQWHSLAVSYSDAEDRLALYVDDVLLAETQASGTTAAMSYWPMVVGESWGATAEVVIDRFLVEAPIESFDMLL